MPLEELAPLLGNIGEFVSSLAVLVTVAILVVQIRQARAEMSLQSQRVIKMHNSETFQQLVGDAELASLHVRGQKDYFDLSDEEKVRWGLWVYTWIQETEIALIAQRDGVAGMDWIESYMNGVTAFVKSKGGNEVWLRARDSFDDGFVEAIDERVQSVEKEWLDTLLD